MVNVTVQTTDEEMKIVLDALSTLPYGQVAKIINSYYSQVSEQVQKQSEQSKDDI